MTNKKKKKICITLSFFAVILIIDIILFYFAFFKDNRIKNKQYKNEYISFIYTSDYFIEEKNSKHISLIKEDESGEIIISINRLSDDVALRDKDIIINEVVNDFENKNQNYYVTYYGEYKTDNYIVKDFLYDEETNTRQIDMNYIIENNKLILITYINNNEYFDLYEQNVLNIINSIKVL